nr:helix-turn-helix domain-containing protein [Candidatus Freyarchaeota archaeon]
METIKNTSTEGVLSALGRPFVQKVFCMLSAFKKLPVKDLERKTGLSARTVYDALTLLENAGLVEREDRGVYTVASNRNARLFSEAYYQLMVTGLSEELTKIIRESDSIKISGKNGNTRKRLLDELEALARDYGNIIEKEFPRSIQEIFLSLSEKSE